MACGKPAPADFHRHRGWQIHLLLSSSNSLRLLGVSVHERNDVPFTRSPSASVRARFRKPWGSSLFGGYRLHFPRQARSVYHRMLAYPPEAVLGTCVKEAGLHVRTKICVGIKETCPFRTHIGGLQEIAHHGFQCPIKLFRAEGRIVHDETFDAIRRNLRVNSQLSRYAGFARRAPYCPVRIAPAEEPTPPHWSCQGHILPRDQRRSQWLLSVASADPGNVPRESAHSPHSQIIAGFHDILEQEVGIIACRHGIAHGFAAAKEAAAVGIEYRGPLDAGVFVG